MSNREPSKSFITSLGMGLDRSSFNGLRPTVAGIGDAGSVLMVFDGARCIGSTLVASDGIWAFQPPANLKNGKHQFTAIAVDHDGNYGVSSEPFSVTVPVVAPVEAAQTPTAVSFWEADDMPAVLAGAANPGDVIRLYDDGTLIATTTGGRWYFDLSEYPPGRHHFTVEASDAAGNKSIPAAVDVTLRLKSHVVINNVFGMGVDPSGDAQEVRVDMSGVTSDPSPTLHGDVYGALNPGEVVAIYRGSVRVGIATIDADHPANRVTWTFQDHDVPEGKHNYRARVEDANGLSGFFGWSYWIEQQAPLVVHAALADVRADDVASFSLGYLPSHADTHSSIAIGVSMPVVGAGVLGSAVESGALLPIDGHSDANLGSSVIDADTPSLAIGLGSIDRVPGRVGLGRPQPVDENSGVNLGNGGLDFMRSNDDHSSPHPGASGVITESQASVAIGVGSESPLWQVWSQVESGSGIGTIRAVGDHQLLDLATRSGKTSAASVHGVEAFDLGGHQNSLKLSLTDVLNLGERDLFVEDSRQQVKVNGQAGDTVDLSNARIATITDGEWQQHGTVALAGLTYNVYLHSGAQAELLVQQDVQTVVH